MAKEFYTILTAAGKEKLLRATVLNKLEIKTFAVGDGQGRYYEPNEDQVALVNQRYKANVNAVSLEGNQITVECLVPSSVGGFTIRELGIYDKEDTLLLIAKYPATEKPVAGSGSEKDLHIKILLGLDNAENVTITADTNVAVATMGNVRNELKKYLQKTDVQNVLTSSDTDKPISAAMGKQLKQELDGLSESKADATNLVNVQEQIAQKLGKNEKAADSELLDGKDSTYFATATAVQAAQATATQGVNAAATAQGMANEAYSRAEQAFTSASNGKVVIANAITGKGIPTSTTGSWLEMARNIGKIKTPTVLFQDLSSRIKLYTFGSVCNRQTANISIVERNVRYYNSSGQEDILGKKQEIVVNSLNTDWLLVIDLGVFNISSYSMFCIPAIAQSTGIPFISKSTLFNRDSFTKEQYESSAAFRENPQNRYTYIPVRQGIDAFGLDNTGYATTTNVTEYHHMGYGRWFLIISIRSKYDVIIKNAIVLN